MTTDTSTPNADKPLYGDYGGWSEPELSHAMQNGFGEVCKHGQLARSCEVCQLERDLSECRVALRELVEASDARVPDEVEDDAEISRIYHANRARALKAWAILRALATKEPQP